MSLARPAYWAFMLRRGTMHLGPSLPCRVSVTAEGSYFDVGVPLFVSLRHQT